MELPVTSEMRDELVLFFPTNIHSGKFHMTPNTHRKCLPSEPLCPRGSPTTMEPLWGVFTAETTCSPFSRDGLARRDGVVRERALCFGLAMTYDGEGMGLERGPS